ncbi:MAG TPA: heparinase II/III family protein [bacterium]|nr:heparinase II/III family protein [bacterium]HQL61071.1 heparinase II/III family protein [bacterium]
MRTVFAFLLAVAPILTVPAAETATEYGRKTASVLYPRTLSDNALANIQKYQWAKDIRESIVNKAEKWKDASDENLWNMMFGSTLHRSWMVWSDGFCPQCNKDVKMYSWKMDPWVHPFKVQCPHCNALFPTNDFAAYYRSGIHPLGLGVFDPGMADRSLLFNADHPDPADPLHLFGVDDGNGYIDNGKRWRFIAAYLIYGQWKRLVVDGIVNLSEAYFVTQDPIYAHKAAILLDRVADVYPSFDFKEQAVCYERKLGSNGYVSMWHDACEEVRELAQAYDRIFDALPGDSDLVAFLSRKAAECAFPNNKDSFEKIQDNIEHRIFRETIQNEYKIQSNYPRTPLAVLTLKAVIGWPSNRTEVLDLISQIIDTSTKVDGVTGEKGLTGYGTIAPRALADMIARFDRLGGNLLEDVYKKHPVLYDTFRFHIDTWCMEQYYPAIGDCCAFGRKVINYCGVSFARPAAGPEPSMYPFLWRLYKLTDDPAFVQALYIANDRKVDGLPHDLCSDDPEPFQKQVQEAIDTFGSEIRLGDVNKQGWHVAILRAGKGPNRRAAWMDYDATGGHGHRDGMNIGYIAKGLDLLPDFGYPPVGYGGWDYPEAVWYTMTAAHNTVVVDCKNQEWRNGTTTLWGSGKRIHLVRASCPEMIAGDRYERTLVMVDLSEAESYLLDVFRVVGGTDHAKFLTPFFGTPQPEGLNLKPGEDFGHDTFMRNTQTDPAPESPWAVDWAIRDFYNDLPNDKNIHFRYTDLTGHAEVSLSECFVDVGENFGGGQQWVSRLTVRRKTGTAPLASCFVSVMDAYEQTPNVKQVKRLPLANSGGPLLDEMSGALLLDTTDGRQQVFVFADRTGDETVVQPDLKLELSGDACFVSGKDNQINYLALFNANSLRLGNIEINLDTPVELLEISIESGKTQILSGDAALAGKVRIGGK